MKEEAITLFLKKHIVMSLNEIRETSRNGSDKTNFELGEVYAYVDCLEMLLQYQGVENCVLLALEEKYGIR